MSSSSTTSERSWLAAAVALGALGAVGCGLQPGDYVVYRVSTTEQTESAGCFYPDFVVPLDDAEDSSSYLSSDTFVLYIGKPDTPYLDTGTVALSGEVTDEGYRFSGRTVEVTYLGANDDVKSTETRDLDVDIAVDGRTITGTGTTTITPRCEYVTPNPAIDLCPDPPEQVCLQTRHFVGVELHGVELERAVDAVGVPVPPPGP